MAEETRKPKAPAKKEPAQLVLNKFLQEKGILIGTAAPEISSTNNGSILINAPKVIAVYKEQAGATKQPLPNNKVN